MKSNRHWRNGSSTGAALLARRRAWILPLLLAALLVSALLALTLERASTQSWLPSVSIEGQRDITEGANAIFTVTASQASLTDLSVSVQIGEWPGSGNVTRASDRGTRTVTIPAGQTSATMVVPTVNDSHPEAASMIGAKLNTPSSSSGYRLDASRGWASVMVSDNDAALPSVSISHSYGLPNVIEGQGVARFTLTPSRTLAQGVTVTVNVAATGSFGVQTGVHSITLPPTGDGSALLIVPLIPDSVNEPDGSVTATIQAGSSYTVGSPASSTLSVLDDDTPQVNIRSKGDVEEGEPVTFTVTASPKPHTSLPVSLKIEPSSLNGINSGLRTVTIPTSGSTTLVVATVDDDVASQGGSITATVQTGSGYDVGSLKSTTVNVAEDDVPVVTITGGSAVTEGGNARFTVTATPAPSNNWLTINLTVAAKGEFGVATGARTVSIPLSGSASFDVSTSNDLLDEADGSVTATLKDGHGYRVGSPKEARVTINDDEATPVSNPTITITAGPDIDEGETATFTITATPPLAPGQSLDVNVDSDVPGALNIRRTERITGATTTITQFSVDNDYDEADYTLSQILVAGNGYIVGDPGRASVTVRDDDLPEVSIRAGKESIDEKGSVTFGLTVSPRSDFDVVVTVQVAAIGDYGVPTGVRTITVPSRPGVTSFTVSAVPDHIDEDDGSLTVTIQPSSAYAIKSGAGSASVIVRDDDDPSGPRLSIDYPSSKARAGEALEFPITLSQPASGEVTVDYVLGTFSPWLWPVEDFQDDDGGINGTITFAAGEVAKVLRVHISPNAFYEHNDRIYVELSNVTGPATIDEWWIVGRLNGN